MNKMTPQTRDDGIDLHFHSARLSDDDIDFLGFCYHKIIAPPFAAVAYAEWLKGVLKAEHERRHGDGENPAETLPVFNGSKWSGDDLGAALMANWFVLSMAREEERATVIELADNLDLALRTWIRGYLNDMESPSGKT